MSDINNLRNQIQAAIDLANQLSQDPADSFAMCSGSLQAARAALAVDDRSADCKCQCHTLGDGWHALPCACYSGNPVL